MDAPFVTGSGAGVIFGITGGVTEAVIRYLLPKYAEEEQALLEGSNVRGTNGIREMELDYQGRQLKIAVASGLNNAGIIMQRIIDGEHFDFVEIMACPGGCVMGGGQPSDLYNYSGASNRERRTNSLFAADEASAVRRANDNPRLNEILASVIKGKEHDLLHRNFS
jgi:NADH-quinone oxidoreductase subunit G